MNATAIKLVVTFWHDDCVEDPCDEDGWRVHSFGRRHHNFRHPDDFDGDDGFGAKLKTGLAFPLAYFEHGGCLWTLAGELPPGADCRFDSTPHAGYIEWESDEGDLGAETVADRREDARIFIERYASWCNGEVYGYTIEAFSKCGSCGHDEEAEADFDLPSCGGYYGDDIEGMLVDMKDHIGSDWADYDVEFKDNNACWADEARRLWKPGA